MGDQNRKGPSSALAGNGDEMGHLILALCSVDSIPGISSTSTSSLHAHAN